MDFSELSKSEDYEIKEAVECVISKTVVSEFSLYYSACSGYFSSGGSVLSVE